MQVSVEAPSKFERRLTVVVPANMLTEAYDKRIVKLAKSAKIAGFRPGKAPLNVVKQRYGDSARQEALSEVIQSSLYAAIDQEKLNPVGVPNVEPKIIVEDQPLEFVATFEVLPEIENFAFNLKTIEKKVAAITDADVTKVIEHLRAQHVTWKKVDRAAQEKDRVIIDFLGSIDDVPFAGGEAHDYPIILGNKTMIAGFEEGITGMKAGENKKIEVTFPANYFAKEVAGKAANFAIKVITVSHAELPEINQDFAKKMGINSGDVKELEAEVRKNLERELERAIKEKLKNQVFDQLIQQNTLEIPKALIEREANRIHDEVHPHHKGAKHSHTEQEMAAFADAAKRNVALGLLVAEVAKRQNIIINPERIQAHLTKLASSYENPAEILEWYAKNKRSMAEIEMQILEEQVVEKLLESVTVVEKNMSYNELINS